MGFVTKHTKHTKQCKTIFIEIVWLHATALPPGSGPVGRFP